jgi:ABC-type antimicrobial peptide transport system permease subunit
VFPRWLAASLAVLVGIPVVHSLMSSIRGRRRDLAVMSALGAGPVTLRSIGVIQGVTVVATGVLLGVPLGIALGRWGWSGLAISFGTIPESVVPLVGLTVLGSSVLALGAILGGLTVWRVNRSAVLRSLRPE